VILRIVKFLSGSPEKYFLGLKLKNKLSSFWIEHSCGSWVIGRGKKIFPVILKTSSMGTSVGIRKPLIEGPPEIVEVLIKANREYMGVRT
jgi:hypothetical protein